MRTARLVVAAMVVVLFSGVANGQGGIKVDRVHPHSSFPTHGIFVGSTGGEKVFAKAWSWLVTPVVDDVQIVFDQEMDELDSKEDALASVSGASIEVECDWHGKISQTIEGPTQDMVSEHFAKATSSIDADIVGIGFMLFPSLSGEVKQLTKSIGEYRADVPAGVGDGIYTMNLDFALEAQLVGLEVQEGTKVAGIYVERYAIGPNGVAQDPTVVSNIELVRTNIVGVGDRFVYKGFRANHDEDNPNATPKNEYGGNTVGLGGDAPKMSIVIRENERVRITTWVTPNVSGGLSSTDGIGIGGGEGVGNGGPKVLNGSLETKSIVSNIAIIDEKLNQ